LASSQLADLVLDPILVAEIDWRYKSFPPGPPVRLADVAEQGWNALDGSFPTPIVILKDKALQHNCASFAEFCRSHDLSLAPHGKTTMAPQLLQRQIQAGAWAVTAASVSQARVWRGFGVDRIILANQIADPAAARWLAGELDADDDLDVYCLVDSLAGVRWLDRELGRCAFRRRLKVMVEVGVRDGRTGCRSSNDAREVAVAVAASRHLCLAGVEGFEGIIDVGPQPVNLGAVDEFLGAIRALTSELDRAALFDGLPEILVSAGGSAFPDRVAATLGSSWELSRPVRVVLRSGCYLTRDAGHYDSVAPFGSRRPAISSLRDALEIWGVVQSIPEPKLALLSFGKRDVSHDLGLPIPRSVSSAGQPPHDLRGASIVRLDDQHAYLHCGPDSRLVIGDLVGCGISHPCTTFDKWRLIPVVDDGYDVIDAVLTFF